MLDLSHLPIIDDHGHPFLPEKETGCLADYASTSLLPGRTETNRCLLVYRHMLRRLAEHLGMGPAADEAAILAQRNERYHADRTGYIKNLFEAADIRRVLVDIGFPSEGFSGYSVSPETFGGLVPCPVGVIIRIEPLLLSLLPQGLGLKEYEDAFLKLLAGEVDKYRTVSVKTAMAYFTGLAFERASTNRIGEALASLYKDPGDLAAAKPFLDHLVFKTVDFCRQRGLPLQIHTGFGNAPLLDITKSNPALLFNLLKEETCQEVPVILLHAGYPYVREAAYLGNNYPNVHIDISQVSQYAGVGLPQILNELWSLTPLSKILYGSDGLGLPELYWFPALYIRRALALALQRLIDDGFLTEPEALAAAGDILSENAARVYKL